MVWEIENYTTRNGRSPVETYFSSLSDDQFAHIDRKVGRLLKYGPRLRKSTNDTKFLRDKIWELRGRCRRVRMRVLYFRDDNKFVLALGFNKKSGPVPDHYIDKAVEYREDYFAQKGES